MTFRATAAGAAQEPTLHCPNCNYEIRLTESLAAPLLVETRRRFQEQLANKDAEVARKSDELRHDREQLQKDRETLDDQVKQRLAAERGQLIAAEGKKPAKRLQLSSRPGRSKRPSYARCSTLTTPS